jgi:hypothetical protein
MVSRRRHRLSDCRDLRAVQSMMSPDGVAPTQPGPAMLTSAEHAVLQCAFAADDALKAYIKIHDRIGEEQATIASLFRNLGGRGMPFEQLLAEAEKANGIWKDFSQFAKQTHSAHRAAISEEEGQFLDALLDYADAVLSTTAILVELQRLLLLRKHQPEAVSWSAYNAIQDRYGASIQAYTRIGQGLNPLVQKVYARAEKKLKNPST